MRVSKRARWALVIVARCGSRPRGDGGGSHTFVAAKKPIVIGWAHDNTRGRWQPFDTPALAAAQLEVKKVNKKGVDGRKIVIKTCNTQGDDTTASKAAPTS